MAVFEQTIDIDQVLSARIKVSAHPDRVGKITFSLDSYTEAQGGGRVFLTLAPMDAERLAAMLLGAAIARRNADKQCA